MGDIKIPQKLTEAEFVTALEGSKGSAARMAQLTGISERQIHARRKRLQAKGLVLPQAPHPSVATKPEWAYPRQQLLDVQEGVVIVYSDAHYWPGEPPTIAFNALVKLCRDLKPVAVIANGDLIDGARISRFAPNGWAKLPTMTEELAEMQARQQEIADAAGRAILMRTIGNHDIRLDRHFVANADAFEGLPGTRLADYLPDWPESYSVQINSDCIVKHRYHGGAHAAYNNVLHAGTHMVTGHLHKLECKPIRGYRFQRMWGVETGTLSNCPADVPAEGGGPFEYAEDNPTHWASGFAVLTFFRGRLLQPEFCSVEFKRAWFRGAEV